MNTTAIAVTVFAAVLLSEIVGDRSIYAIASLTGRFGMRAVLSGVAPAYAIKTLAAVLAANAVSHLPPVAIAAVSCLTWLLAAWAVWRREEEAQPGALLRQSRPALVAFGAVAFTEWGDPGQLTTALLAIRFHAPLLVWSSATVALMTKSAAAAIVGVTARRYLALGWLRFAAAGFCIVSAAVSAAALFQA